MKKFFFILFSLIFIFDKQIQASENLSNTTYTKTETYVNVGEVTLFCRAMGQGKPLIVLHGGAGLTQDYLLPEMEKLSEDHFVIFYDQRGCGGSTGNVDEKSINIENYIKDLEAIREHFGFEKVSILGHSWGGFLAMSYAIAHPGSVDKLILSNSMPASAEEVALFVDEWLKRVAPFQEKIKEIQETQEFTEGDPDTVERYYRTIFRTYCYNPEKADLLNLRMTPTAFLKGLGINQIFRKNVFLKPFNLHDALRKLDIPTLIIHGDVDPIPPCTAERLHESICDSKYILMKQCGHFPYVEDSEVYFRHLREFLSSTSTSAGD